MTNQKNEIIIHEENKDSMSLPVIQWEGQRVITLQQVAEVHGILLKTVQKAFQRYVKTKFIQGDIILSLMEKQVVKLCSTLIATICRH